MKLSKAQLEEFDARGYLFLPSLFTRSAATTTSSACGTGQNSSSSTARTPSMARALSVSCIDT